MADRTRIAIVRKMTPGDDRVDRGDQIRIRRQREQCGVVADSVPASEYQETLNKARALLVAAELAARGGRP